MVCFSQCSSDKKQPSLSSFLWQFLAYIFYYLTSRYFMMENIWVPSPEIIATSSLWLWVQSPTLNMLFSHVDHAAANRCRCQDFIWWLCGLCGPRRNHGKIWKMLLSSTWGGCSKTELPRATETAPGWMSASPRGHFNVSVSNPALGLLPYPCPSLGHKLSHCY